MLHSYIENENRVVFVIQGEKTNKGQVVVVTSEADVFKYLDLDFLQPTDRDW